jgi:hypothetical protein
VIWILKSMLCMSMTYKEKHHGSTKSYSTMHVLGFDHCWSCVLND